MDINKITNKLISAVKKLNSDKNQFVLFSNGTFIVFDSIEYCIFSEEDKYLANKNIPIEQRSLKHISLVQDNNNYLHNGNMDMAVDADDGWFVSFGHAGMFTFVLEDEHPFKQKNHTFIEDVAKKKLTLDKNGRKIIFIKDGLKENVFSI